MAVNDLCEGDMFEIRGKLWEVIGYTPSTIRVKGENGEMSSIPTKSKILVQKI